MDASAGWITVITAGLAALAGAGVKWLAQKHKQGKEDREYEEGIWAKVSEKQERQIEVLISKVEALQQSEAECQRRFAVLQTKMDETDRRLLEQEKEISILREQLGK